MNFCMWTSWPKVSRWIICVDLDGTLIRGDVTRMSVTRFFLLRPYLIFHFFGWLLKGGWAYAKAKMADHVAICVARLPYNKELIFWLLSLREQGAHLFLVTATHRTYAHQIACHLCLFEKVFASDEKQTLGGRKKRDVLNREFGRGRYVYCGNESVDLPVWRAALACVVVDPPRYLLHKLQREDLPILAKFFR